MKQLQKHIEIVERMMFAMANHTVDGKRIYPTLKAAKDVLEKQIPKKPIITIDGFFNGQPIYDTWGCPNCGKVNETDFGDYEYCHICGQSLDWSDEK